MNGLFLYDLYKPCNTDEFIGFSIGVKAFDAYIVKFLAKCVALLWKKEYFCVMSENERPHL